MLLSNPDRPHTRFARAVGRSGQPIGYKTKSARRQAEKPGQSHPCAPRHVTYAGSSGVRTVVTVRYPDPKERRSRLQAELDRLLPLIIDEQTELVVLFGSMAQGRLRSTSDLDILVVRSDSRRPAERMDELYRRLQSRVALDLLVYTPEELKEARANSSFIRHALREGKILYDRSKAVTAGATSPGGGGR